MAEPIIKISDDTPAILTLEKIIEPGLSLDRRPGALSFDYLTAYTLGPVDIGDFSLGIGNRIWRGRMYNSEFKIARQNLENDESVYYAETLVLDTGLFPQEIDVAFDQAGRVFLTMEVDGHIWIYFFDPILSDFQLVDTGEGRTPRCTIDHLIDVSNDIILFYIRDGRIRYRTQDDRYVAEHDSLVTANDDMFLEDATLSQANRVALLLSRRQGDGRYRLEQLFSTLQPLTLDEESLKANATLQSGELKIILFIVSPTGQPEDGTFGFVDVAELQGTISLVGGTLAEPVIQHTLFDIDELTATLSISGTLAVVLIVHELFDKDEMTATLSLNSGTLAAIVIENTLFDDEELTASLELQSGILEVV